MDKFTQTVYKIGEKYNLETCCYGHCGDGNQHVNLISNDEENQKQFIPARKELFESLSAINGSISAEHGIGIKKTAELKSHLEKSNYEIMLMIKRQLDPLGIMNPGKIFPDNIL